MKTLPPIGCHGRGAQASSLTQPVSFRELPIEGQMRLVKEAGVFDFFDRQPLPHEVSEFLGGVGRHALPVFTGTWSYQLGRDKDALARNAKAASEVGTRMHNVMLFKHRADGRLVTDEEVVEFYLQAFDVWQAVGIEIAFEVHVNMWSEDFRRIAPVARAIQARGVPFNFTLDYSHIIFKIGNEREQAVSGIRDDVVSGRLVLDPFEAGNLCDEWLSMGIVRWLQVRGVAPNGPANLWSRIDPDTPNPGMLDQADHAGEFGRGILYPFTRPEPGEWHSEWFAYKLELAKEVVRKVMRRHLVDATSPLTFITTEMINLPDYADGARFSLIGQNAAIAAHLRRLWHEMSIKVPMHG